ncbi:MAG: 6,7-dimethyl-8-ribityllumazine synthase [Candidatus Peribacteraceae bacterium]|nr:6,7-dimethyl-8-ribityllumazine synthase [Candidatus Peribacteraceae bacterium]MDD5742880.1 6,7-dimethyl-8-ribityllumazine synthase [Candidatus Peribacteraceae bacterium]
MQTDQHFPLPARISSGWRIGIVHSLYYPDIVSKLVAGAQAVFKEAGLAPGNVRTYAAPGSFEIPLIGAALIASKEVDALIALGVIVEGETHHAALIAGEAARAIMDLQVRHRLPFAFEILYVREPEQARARTNRGAEAARAVLHALAQIEPLHP